MTDTSQMAPLVDRCGLLLAVKQHMTEIGWPLPDESRYWGISRSMAETIRTTREEDLIELAEKNDKAMDMCLWDLGYHRTLLKGE